MGKWRKSACSPACHGVHSGQVILTCPFLCFTVPPDDVSPVGMSSGRRTRGRTTQRVREAGRREGGGSWCLLSPDPAFPRPRSRRPPRSRPGARQCRRDRSQERIDAPWTPSPSVKAWEVGCAVRARVRRDMTRPGQCRWDHSLERRRVSVKAFTDRVGMGSHRHDPRAFTGRYDAPGAMPSGRCQSPKTTIPGTNPGIGGYA